MYNYVCYGGIYLKLHMLINKEIKSIDLIDYNFKILKLNKYDFSNLATNFLLYKWFNDDLECKTFEVIVYFISFITSSIRYYNITISI